MNTWNITRQTQLDQLLAAKQAFADQHLPAIELELATMVRSTKLTSAQITDMLNNATEIIKLLKPFSRIPS